LNGIDLFGKMLSTQTIVVVVNIVTVSTSSSTDMKGGHPGSDGHVKYEQRLKPTKQVDITSKTG